MVATAKPDAPARRRGALLIVPVVLIFAGVLFGGHVYLAQRLIEGLEGTVLRIVVTDLREGIYYARIDLDQEGRSVSIDARPSDAIAIGLRLGAPLFVRARLFESGGLPDGGPGRAIRGRAIERQVPGRRL